jgi:hypothetical protein
MGMKRNLMKLVALILVIGLMGASLAVAADEKAITGTVQQTDKGFVISSDAGEVYDVQGQDVSAMVGKQVKAIGTLEEGAGGKTLNVTAIEVIQ